MAVTNEKLKETKANKFKDSYDISDEEMGAFLLDKLYAGNVEDPVEELKEYIAELKDLNKQQIDEDTNDYNLGKVIEHYQETKEERLNKVKDEILEEIGVDYEEDEKKAPAPAD